MDNMLTQKLNKGKLLAIISNIFIFIALLILLRTPVASTYEISIYSVLPVYFWIFIIAAILVGISVLIHSYRTNDKIWIFGFISILIADSVLLFLPVIRNYYFFGRGDVLIHIGNMINILDLGRIGSNTYPLVHIFGAAMYYLTNIPFNLITIYMMPFFSLLFIISFYLLFKNKIKGKEIPLALIFSSILLYGPMQITFAPFNIAFLLIPLFLYCYINSRQSYHKLPFSVITLLLTFFITFSHPIVTAFLIIILLVFELSNKIYSKFFLKSKLEINNPYNLILIMLVILLMWQSYTYVMINSLKSVFNFVFGETFTGSSQLESYSSVISYGNPNIFDIVTTFFNMYGVAVIVIFISLFTILYLVKNKNKINMYSLFASISLIIFIFWSFLTLTLVYIFGFGRILSVAILVSVFLVFLCIKYLIHSKHVLMNNNIKIVILTCILLPIVIFSTLNLYYSPLTKTANEQITISELDGFQTFLNIRNRTSNVFGLGVPQYNLFAGLYGTYDPSEDFVGRDQELNHDRLNIANLQPIDHLGYNNKTSLYESYNKSSYFLVNDLAKLTYPTLYPSYESKWRFTPNDFLTLDKDMFLGKIYDNGNLNIYSLFK